MLSNLKELESQARQFAIETSKEGKSLLSLLNDLKTIAGLGRIFQKLQLVELQRDPTLETYKAIHVKQTEDLEASMEEDLVPHFNRVLKDVAGKIPSVPTDITDEDKAAKTAKRVIDSIFTDSNLDEYNKDLFKSSIPSLGEAFAKGAITQFDSHKALGLLDGVKSDSDEDENKDVQLVQKVTSAEQLVEDLDLEVPPGISIEAPEWLKENARAELEETMSQDYWLDIHGGTTRNDITNLLERSLLEGVSTRNIAKSIVALGGDYSRNRAMRIARTEIPNVLNSGHNSGINQVAEETGLDIGKEWVSVLGNTTRDSHADIDGEQVEADGLFTLGGVDVPWPAHVALPPEERINCFPGDTIVEGSFQSAQRALYTGIVTKIVTRSGRRLTLTPNHPVLTEDGFVAAGKLNRGDQVVAYNSEIDFPPLSSTSSNQVDDKPVSIEQIFEAFSSTTMGVEISSSQVDDFYGDGEFVQSNIEIVRPDWELLLADVSSGFEESSNPVFVFVDSQLLTEHGSGSLSLSRFCVDLPTSSSECITCDPTGVVFRPDFVSRSLGVGHATDFDPGFDKLSSKQRSTMTGLFSDLEQRYPGVVLLDEIVEIRNVFFSDHVYDLQSSVGVIIANGIVTSNCFCTLISTVLSDEIRPTEEEPEGEPEKPTEEPKPKPKPEEDEEPETVEAAWTDVDSLKDFETQLSKLPGIGDVDVGEGWDVSNLNAMGKDLSRVHQEHPKLKGLVGSDLNMRLDRGVKEGKRFIGGMNARYEPVGYNDSTKPRIQLTPGQGPNKNANSTIKLGRSEYVAEKSSFNGTMRHEMGHLVQDKIEAKDSQVGKDWDKVLSDIGGKAKGVKWKDAISEYGATDRHEMFAESFSAWTHKDYGTKGDRLPKGVEKFMSGLTGKEVPKR